MADGGSLLGGYKVGLISACLNPKNEEKGKNYKVDINSLLFSNSIVKPNFVPVERKKPKKHPDLTKQKKVEGTENKPDEEIGNETKRKYDLENMTDLQTRKRRQLLGNNPERDDPERLARTLFVGNLPITISRKNLKQFFKKYGEIESARLRSVAVPDLQTSKKLAVIKKQFNPNCSNVNAYVVFKEKESIEKALESNGTMIGDLHIRVDRADSRGKQYDHKRSIFVGNLIFDIKEEALSDLFAICGEIQGVRVVRDSATGIGKGFGYVLFKEASSVSLALKMNHSELCGRKIRVQPSQEKHKELKGVAMKKGRIPKNYSGMQAKEKYYHKRKALKQLKKFGLSNSKKHPSKTIKRRRQSLKQ